MRSLVAALCLFLLACFSLEYAGAQQNAGVKAPRVCTGCNFAGAQLAGSDLTNAVYIGTNFEGTNLAHASFRGAKLLAANFQGADLKGAIFDGAQCTACNFAAAELDGATFAGVQMLAASFKGFAASVDDAQLRALLSGCISCNFQSGRLAGRDLSGATLISVNFSQADLRSTKFDGAVICWYSVDESQRATKCDSMANAQVEGASFRNVQLCDDPIERRACVTVDAQTLRSSTGSGLTGAVITP
jgi:uncharacterized protein YjbI with pentapeptide repeats